jgi:hypothetical protein
MDREPRKNKTGGADESSNVIASIVRNPNQTRRTKMKDEKTGKQFNSGDDDFQTRIKKEGERKGIILVKDIAEEIIYQNEGFACAVEIKKIEYIRNSDGQKGTGIEVCVGNSSDMGNYYTWYPGTEGWTIREIWTHVGLLINLPQTLENVNA